MSQEQRNSEGYGIEEENRSESISNFIKSFSFNPLRRGAHQELNIPISSQQFYTPNASQELEEIALQQSAKRHKKKFIYKTSAATERQLRQQKVAEQLSQYQHPESNESAYSQPTTSGHFEESFDTERQLRQQKVAEQLTQYQNPGSNELAVSQPTTSKQLPVMFEYSQTESFDNVKMEPNDVFFDYDPLFDNPGEGPSNAVVPEALDQLTNVLFDDDYEDPETVRQLLLLE